MSKKEPKIAPAPLKRLSESNMSGQKIADFMKQLMENAKKTGKMETLVLDYMDPADILEDTDFIPTVTFGLRQAVEK